jgi:hypothetical protein
MSEYVARIETASGPTTLCAAVQIGKFWLPRTIKIMSLVPRDAQACWQWLTEHVCGREVFLIVDRVDKAGNYVAEIEVDGYDVATMMIAEGIAD